MSINLSAFAGAGAQFFDANGVPLSGGLIYTYLSGTSTPATTYTARGGTVNNTNPIVLDAAGRTPAEVWLDGGVLYKFVLKSSTNVQIGSYDGVPSINDPTTANNLITVAGTNTLTGLATPPLNGYTVGSQYTFVAQNTNTGAVTLDIDSLGVKAVTKFGSTALAAGDIIANSLVIVEYDGTRFQALNPSSANSLIASNASISSNGTNLLFKSGAGFIYSNLAGTTTLFTVDSSGNIIATANVTAFSDARLKSNVATLQNALDTVDKLRGVSFVKDDKPGIGVIAQEVQKVFPELVVENENGYLSVAYGNLVGVLIEAIKELRTEVKALKGE